ncbi:MAG: hypothetical protein A2958_02730 [Candidatus Levybacteria bacterium RIFCSPLOWO2_01_FULL_38_13]|nr:MAG: hypothetical protein A2958_02730 [Candidatus Levybacteria bacterium RIFCSPLOWO2_01_FULL_38_13]
MQYLHFPFRKTEEKRGTMSYQARDFLQWSQYDLPLRGDCPCGILSIKTFKKLPTHIPMIKRKNKRAITISLQ